MSAGCGGFTGVRNGIVAERSEEEEAAARGDGDVYRGNNHRTVVLAALVACHRLRASITGGPAVSRMLKREGGK